MNNDKLTPQEAALYLGQEVQRYNERLNKSITGWLKGITPLFLQIQYGLTTARVEYSEAKLLLRPLSDITEEEAKHLEFSETNEAIWYYTRQKTLTPQDFQYLLSRGFDLFKWIESGKALDKTKIKDSVNG